MRDEPSVTEGVRDHSRSCAIELLLDGTDERRALLQCTAHGLLGVRYDEVETDPGSAPRGRTDGSEIRMFVGQHQQRVANSNFGMADAAVRIDQSEEFLGSKGSRVEIQGIGGVLDDEMRKDRILAPV